MVCKRVIAMSKSLRFLFSLLALIVIGNVEVYAQTVATGISLDKSSIVGGSTDTVTATITVSKDPNDYRICLL
jgi:hypothetical protein